MIKIFALRISFTEMLLFNVVFLAIVPAIGTLGIIGGLQVTLRSLVESVDLLFLSGNTSCFIHTCHFVDFNF